MLNLKAFVLIVCVALASPSLAQDLVQGPQDDRFAGAYAEAADGRQAMIEGDIDAAIALSRPLAMAGNPVAQNVMGIALTRSGTHQYDITGGMSWYMRAASQGYAKAWHNLGETHRDGEASIPANEILALAAFRAGAALGYELSFVEAARLLSTGGEGVLDEAAAVRLAEEGLELFPGNSGLLNVLADGFYFGWGRPVDEPRSFTLFQQAASLDPENSYALYSAGYMLMRGEGTEADIAAAVPMLEAAWQYGSVLSADELAIVHGHPEFAGPWSDMVRGWGFCEIAIGMDALEYYEPDDLFPVACETLDASLSDAQKAEGRALADTLRR